MRIKPTYTLPIYNDTVLGEFCYQSSVTHYNNGTFDFRQGRCPLVGWDVYLEDARKRLEIISQVMLGEEDLGVHGSYAGAAAHLRTLGRGTAQ